MSTSCLAHRRGMRDFHLRQFENPYPAGASRQAWHAGFREAAQQYRSAVRAQRADSDQRQAVAR
jgi:hypothetical protein